MYVIICIHKGHKGAKKFGILPLSGFHQTIREFEMRYTTKLYIIIVILTTVLFWRECVHANRYHNLIHYQNTEINEILDACVNK